MGLGNVVGGVRGGAGSGVVLAIPFRVAPRRRLPATHRICWRPGTRGPIMRVVGDRCPCPIQRTGRCGPACELPECHMPIIYESRSARTWAAIACAALLFPACASQPAPSRLEGISAHLLPKRASLPGMRESGFLVSQGEHTEPQFEHLVFPTAETLLAHVEAQPSPTRRNGIWLVGTNPDAYGEEELKEVEDLKTGCRERRIPLFVCRGKDLPDGWSRYDNSTATARSKMLASTLVERGWEALEQGDVDKALKGFQEAVRQDETHAPGYYGIAYVHSVRHELDEAIEFYRRTLEYDQCHPYTFANLGNALLQKGQHREALRMLDRALELMPACGEAHLSYANYHAYKGDWKAAGESANKAIACGQKLHPEFRSILVSHGVVIVTSGAGPEAVR